MVASTFVSVFLALLASRSFVSAEQFAAGSSSCVAAGDKAEAEEELSLMQRPFNPNVELALMQGQFRRVSGTVSAILKRPVSMMESDVDADVHKASFDALGNHAQNLLHSLDHEHSHASNAAQTRMQNLGMLLTRFERMIDSNTVTPDVVNFANSTLQTLAARTIPAILDGHEADQNYLDGLFAAFAGIEVWLAGQALAVENLRKEENRTSTEHKTCRAEEQVDCDELHQCEVELQELWDEVLTTESHLHVEHEAVDGLFCNESVNGTAGVFRFQAVTNFKLWIEKENLTAIAWVAYQEHVPVCVQHWHNLIEKRAECAIKQGSLETASCNLGHEAATVAIQLREDWTHAIFAYDAAAHSIKLQEHDRKLEYVTLQTVQCLISQIHERTASAPCDNDTHPEETANEITNCETMETNTSHLDIHYNNTPAEPLPPSAFPPCTPEYVEREYAEFNNYTEGCVEVICSTCSVPIPVLPPPLEPVPIDCNDTSFAPSTDLSSAGSE